MNKWFLFALCLVTTTLQAKYYKATLIYENGTTKSGFAELVDNKTKNVRFKTSGKGGSEKISSSELSKIVFYSEKGDSIAVERLYNNEIKNDGTIKRNKEKEWYYVYYSNKLKVVGGSSVETGNMLSAGKIEPGSEVSYYLGKEGDENIYYLYYNSPKNISGLAGFDLDDQIVKISKQLFQDSCPDLINKLEIVKFKYKNAIPNYIDFYTSTCGSVNTPIR